LLSLHKKNTIQRRLASRCGWLRQVQVQEFEEIAVDPLGRFVFALAQDTVYQFKVSSSGTLVPNGTASLPGNVPEQTAGAIMFVQH
jgi:hypothetical protein